MSAPRRLELDAPATRHPLGEVAGQVTRLVGMAGSLVTALVGYGVLTAVRGDAVIGLLGAVPGVVTLVTAALAAFGVVRRGEPLVTPVADPRTDAGVPLVPAPLAPPTE